MRLNGYKFAESFLLEFIEHPTLVAYLIGYLFGQSLLAKSSFFFI